MFQVDIQGVIAAKALALSLCLFSLLATVHAQSASEREILEQELRVTEHLLAQKEGSQTRTPSELAMINRQIELRERLLGFLALEIIEHENEIGEIDDQICLIQESVDGIRENYAESVRAMYQIREEHIWLSVLASGSLSEAFFRIRLYRQLSDYREQQLSNLKRSEDILQRKHESLNRTLARKEALRVQRFDEANKLRRAVSRREIVSSEIQKQGTVSSPEQQLEFVQKTVKQNPQSTQQAGPAPEQPDETVSVDYGSSFRKSRGQIPWPIRRNLATLIADFGQQEDIYGNPVQNDGITLSTSIGESVYAVHSGVITGVQNIPNGGSVVIIAHGSYRTVYAGLQGLNRTGIKRGMTVSQGQELGTIFTDSRTGESNLQFMIYEEPDHFLNPMTWMSR